MLCGNFKFVPVKIFEKQAIKQLHGRAGSDRVESGRFGSGRFGTGRFIADIGYTSKKSIFFTMNHMAKINISRVMMRRSTRRFASRLSPPLANNHIHINNMIICAC